MVMMMMIMIAAMVDSMTTPIVSLLKKLLKHHGYDHQHHHDDDCHNTTTRITVSDGGVDCIVCLSDVVSGEKYGVLPNCKHGFHVECVEAWLKDHSTCPLCRTPAVAPPQHDDNNMQHTSNCFLYDKVYETLSCYSVSVLQSLCSWLTEPFSQGLQTTLSESCNYL